MINKQLTLSNSNFKGERFKFEVEKLKLRSKMPLCHFSIYIHQEDLFRHLKLVPKIKIFKKINQNLKDCSMVVNDQFTCQECRKVQITERIFPKELENLFKLEKFSNYRDSNYGKKIIIVSLG